MADLAIAMMKDRRQWNGIFNCIKESSTPNKKFSLKNEGNSCSFSPFLLLLSFPEQFSSKATMWGRARRGVCVWWGVCVCGGGEEDATVVQGRMSEPKQDEKYILMEGIQMWDCKG